MEARGRSAEGAGEGESERAGEGAYVVAGGSDARDLHGFRLLLGGIGVGVDPEEKGEEGVDKAPSVLIRRGGEVRREAAAHGIEGTVIDALELHKVLEPAAVLDVVEVHGHEFQHTAAPREYVRKPRSEILRGEGDTLGKRVKILAPGGVFPLQQREEDLLLGAEIVVYGRAREGRLCADRAQRYVLERECGIELRASVDDLFFSRIREFFRSFRHINLRFATLPGHGGRMTRHCAARTGYISKAMTPCQRSHYIPTVSICPHPAGILLFPPYVRRAAVDSGNDRVYHRCGRRAHRAYLIWRSGSPKSAAYSPNPICP